MQPARYAAVALLIAGHAHAATAPAIELRGQGTQIYVCAITASGHAWHLKAPDATLKTSAGALFGHHSAGPTWQATDGSAVVGEVIVSSPAPQPSSIPWLLLRAKSHAGSGILVPTAYITRTETAGGVAPAQGCDPSHAGAEARIPYSAIYTLFPTAPPP